jgi:hypothetical protein
MGGSPHRDPHRDRAAGSAVKGRLGHRVADSTGDGIGPLGIGGREDDGKLVAAVAGGDIGASQAAGNDPRHPGQDLVAQLVAKAVVHLLEPVQVEHEEAHRLLPSRGQNQLLAQPLVEGAVVEEPGEGIVVGQPSGLLIEVGVLQCRPSFVG